MNPLPVPARPSTPARTRIGRWIAPLVAIFAALLAFGCATGSYRPANTAADSPFNSALLREGDVVQVTFPGATNLNTLQRVGADGALKLPLVGDFPAAGKTPETLKQDILASYGPQLQVKEVTVTLVSSAAVVYVSGAVLRPGKVSLDRPMTALEAIMESGGFTPNRAQTSKVLVIRQEDGKQVTYRLDLNKALNGKDTEVFYVKPSDAIVVPVKPINL